MLLLNSRFIAKRLTNVKGPKIIEKSDLIPAVHLEEKKRFPSLKTTLKTQS